MIKMKDKQVTFIEALVANKLSFRIDGTTNNGEVTK